MAGSIKIALQFLFGELKQLSDQVMKGSVPHPLSFSNVTILRNELFEVNRD